MDISSINEIQWLIISISFSGIFYNIGYYIGMSLAIDYFTDDQD